MAIAATVARNVAAVHAVRSPPELTATAVVGDAMLMLARDAIQLQAPPDLAGAPFLVPAWSAGRFRTTVAPVVPYCPRSLLASPMVKPG